MRNYIQPGDVLTLPAPYALTSGEGFRVGDIFAVAATDAASGAPVEGATVGVFELPKILVDSIGVGERVYWDAGEKLVTDESDYGANLAIGVAVAAAGDTASLVRVRLNGSF